jgi:hypothetical protein
MAERSAEQVDDAHRSLWSSHGSIVGRGKRVTSRCRTDPDLAGPPTRPFGPSTDRLVRNYSRMTSSTWAPGRWRRELAAWMPVAVPLAMEPVFTRAIRRFGPERGYQVGFAIYWVTCWTVAGAIAGPRRLAGLWQPAAACQSCSNHESTGSTSSSASSTKSPSSVQPSAMIGPTASLEASSKRYSSSTIGLTAWKWPPPQYPLAAVGQPAR